MTTRRSALGWIQRAVPAPLTPISIVLFPIQFFLGLGWIRAGVEKLISPAWWDGSALTGFLDAHAMTTVGFMSTVASTVFAPLVLPISLLVMLTQPLIGLSLITGRAMRPALCWGVTLNIVFILMGVVSPSVFYLVIELALLAALDVGIVGHSSRKASVTVAVVWAGAALAAVPFVTTLAPSKVIEDPGIIIVTVASIAAATESLRLLADRFAASPPSTPSTPQSIAPCMKERAVSSRRRIFPCW